MRSLVEQTERNVRAWLSNLAANCVNDVPRADCGVHVLMGGVDEPRWQLAPERPAILIGTQDMLISRALMRGYASGRARWPIDFALLHNDAQWVFDEVQLMGTGLATSTQLEAFRRELGTAIPARSLWVSATLDPGWLGTVDFAPPPRSAVLKVPEDVPEDAGDPRVRRLLDAPKPLARTSFRPAGGKAAEISAYVQDLAAFVAENRSEGGLTLVMVNTVERAQKLHAALRKTGLGEDGLVLLHSRFRPPDRARQMDKALSAGERIMVATQALEAGVDLSAAVLMTEIAPWASLVQRFGRANRYGERNEMGGAPVFWIDLPDDLAAPYDPGEFGEARRRLAELSDVAPSHLPGPGAIEPPRRVIRRKDLIDLFDTDPDLTGFDVDISPYVRDAQDTDIRVFWRDLSGGHGDQPGPGRNELCAIPIGRGRNWLKSLRSRAYRAYRTDPQAARGDPAWVPLEGDPWPGLTLMLDLGVGGYEPARGFTGEAVDRPEPLGPPGGGAAEERRDADRIDGDPQSEGYAVGLRAHTDHVVRVAGELCTAGLADGPDAAALLRAARWHDLGKTHPIFQDTMRRGLVVGAVGADELLAKTDRQHMRHERAYFRHELASALAWLVHQGWSREADLVAYLIAAHHGKVRLSLRAYPAEKPPPPDQDQSGRWRFARGVWEGDQLPAVDLGGGDCWEGGELTLSIMELGEDPVTGASWTERTRGLLDRYGPFRLARLEALLRVADWRASEEERGDG